MFPPIENIQKLYQSKIENTTKIKEFRPINVLPQYEKILKKIVAKQLEDFFKTNTLFIKEQYGFLEGKSCENAVQEIVSDRKKNKLLRAILWEQYLLI